ncbi:unnamed protein product [Rotaria sordida]|uniref:Uncharacterized protein n=2 Tax=Rotaria sordida TaxID=392033 RepID=A0A814ZFX5_9BILA|nr:unnamed protein product [Rotaria sordida]
MYMQCDDIICAQLVFNTTTKKPLSMCGAMMKGNYGNLMNRFNKENNPSKILNLFNQTKLDCFEVDLIIYLCVIKALFEIGNSSVSQFIIKQIPDSFLVDNNIRNALIDMWVDFK